MDVEVGMVRGIAGRCKLEGWKERGKQPTFSREQLYEDLLRLGGF